MPPTYYPITTKEEFVQALERGESLTLITYTFWDAEVKKVSESNPSRPYMYSAFGPSVDHYYHQEFATQQELLDEVESQHPDGWTLFQREEK